MAPSLFRSGLIPRLGGALAFGCAAFGAVFLLRGERPETPAAPPRAGAPPPARAEAPATASERIEIESVRAVASWTVRLDGETVAGAESDAHTWSGSSTSPAALMSIDITLLAEGAADPAASANSLRIRLRSGNTGIEWIEWIDPGELVILPLDQLRARAPGTPESDNFESQIPAP